MIPPSGSDVVLELKHKAPMLNSAYDAGGNLVSKAGGLLGGSNENR